MSDEDSPLRRPRRTIKRVTVLSDSESDSDGSVAPPATRRKRLRVLSDEGSDSSSSSIVMRRKRTLPKLRDSEDDSDTSGWATDHSDAPRPASGAASDSSDGNSDKCSICLLRFSDQEVGTPQTCEHIFCLDCIIEWSKNVNTCPVDRITFTSLVVRACAGGRVLRTVPVTAPERRPSEELLVQEDPTPCEICRSTDNEEMMLLCDTCDLGYHMQCLTPPLTEIPMDEWHCPACDLGSFIRISELDDLFNDIVDLELPLAPRPTPLRMPRQVRRSARNQAPEDEPSTSSGHTERTSQEAPSSSRGTRTQNSSGSRARTTTRSRAAGTKRRKRRRTTKTVIIEYELEENGKFPITKTVKRKVKKRKSRKRPRTAARRSQVRASVRARLRGLSAASQLQRALSQQAACTAGVRRLGDQQRRAGLAPLSLFGDANALDYFSDDENVAEVEGGLAVAARPTSTILSALRQARRKMISIPSPPRARAAPDLLGSILESQTLLHSKNSIVSVAVDGKVDIKLENHGRPKTEDNKAEKVDLSKGEDAAKKVPSYPGQRGGGGGWGGGYRGNYHRDHATGNFSRAYENNYQPAHPPAYHQNNMNNNSMREPEEPQGSFFPRRPAPAPFERPRRPDLRHNTHSTHNTHNNYNSHGPRPEHSRYSMGPQWQSRTEAPPSRQSFGGFESAPPSRQSFGSFESAPPLRQSFGGFESAPLDMRTAPAHLPAHTAPGAPPHAPLPAPPPFPFEREDEDQGSLVIDTEKYDPTEPTVDEDSGEERDASPPLLPLPAESFAQSPPAGGATPPPPLAPPPEPPLLVQGLLAELGGEVPAGVLDTAVRQVLEEHRSLLAPPPRPPSDDDSDGDCPNFSIYSATSVHIANSGNLLNDPHEPPNLITEPEEEEKHPSEPVSPVEHAESPVEPAELDNTEPNKPEVKNKDDEFKAKVSKRCPITPNTRNPIKIKLNTTSLIKKTMSLYDDEAVTEEVESEEKESGKTGNEVLSTNKSNYTPEGKLEEDLDKGTTEENKQSDENDEEKTPERIERSMSDIEDDATKVQVESEHDAEDKAEDKERDDASDKDEDNASEELRAISRGSKDDEEKNDETVEKMTESISETEDERSYTPCLDENKSKDTSFETDKDKNLEGLDTEMISEEEGNDMFSDTEKPSETETARPVGEEGEIVDKKKEDEAKKKKKKESKKEGKDKKSKKKADVSFKKLSKSGKERNYRDKKEKENEDAEAVERKRRKEKRKDLERYDVRTVVTEKRNKVKDAFGRDVSPPPSPPSPRRRVSLSPRRRSITPRRRSISPRRRSISPRRRSISPRRRSISPRRRSISPRRRSISPRRRSISLRRRSISPRRRSISPRRRSISPRRRSISPRRRSITPRRRTLTPRRVSLTPRRKTISPRRRKSISVHKSVSPPRRAPRKSASPRRKRAARRRRSVSKGRKRRRSASPSPKPKITKKKKRRAASPPPKKVKRKRKRAVSRSPAPSPPRAAAWSPASVDSRLLSPRTPPAPRPRRVRAAPPPAKEVFTSGDNILVSVSFKEQERVGAAEERRRRRETRRERRRQRRRAAEAESAAKPVAIIDLERSPFAEIAPSPRNVIVLSDASEPGDKEPARPPPAEPAPPPAAAAPPQPAGPKTPPEPAAPPAAERVPSPDAYDPFEPTRSPSPQRTPPHAMTLETAQKTNLSADDVIDRRPITPIEKVMALLQSTRDISPDPPPSDSQQETDEKAAAAAPAPAAAASPCAPPAPPAAAPAPPAAPPVRIVLPSPTRTQPKLFLAKPSPIKSNPVKPMQATKISRLPLPAVPARREEGSGGESPYSPGSSDFGDLFSPPGGGGGGGGRGRRDIFDSLLPDKPRRGAKVPVKLRKKKGNKMQVGVKIDEDSLKILDELPSSAVEMQVKSKFLKKLNRQERVVEEVKLVLKPHYNRKRVTKEQYKQIMRRAVPKICHNKTGEINTTKIQALVEAYVKKFRKKNKLGLPL